MLLDELNHVEEYIQIQSYRYPEQFDYMIHCDVDVRDNKIPKLVLQPLVENAFIHGFKEGSKGMIQIHIEEVEAGIVLKVCDNGNGISDEKINNISGYLENPEQGDESNSIGLKNVHDRIRPKFGKPYGISIIPRTNPGACVEILVPKT